MTNRDPRAASLSTTNSVRDIFAKPILQARRAEAREASASALGLARPAANPPAHVLARASAGMKSLRIGERIAVEAAMAIGTEGCKIKGGLARCAQVIGPLQELTASVVPFAGTGLATRAQADVAMDELCYPTSTLRIFLGIWA